MTWECWLALWYICGIIGCVIGTRVDLYKGEDFTLGELALCSLGSLFGLIILIYAICYHFDQKGPIVLIKGRDKNERGLID